jgi:hypothetical protein
MINMLLNFVLFFLGILTISNERPENLKVVDLKVSYKFSIKYLHLTPNMKNIILAKQQDLVHDY